MTCGRLKVAFFLLLNASVSALETVEYGSGDHVCPTNEKGGNGTCYGKNIEIYAHSDFSLDCGEGSACRSSTIVVGSGSTFTGDFVCADDSSSYNSCREAHVTFYATDVSTYKVSCHNSGEWSSSCQETVFTLVDTSLEIYCDTGECQNMVVNLCGDSHVHVSGTLDSGYPVVINRYGDDATATVDETGSYSITNSAAEQCPVLHFACADGCEIVAGYVDDGVCDCSECEDEIAFDCDSCYNGCSAQCGQRNQCTNSFVCGDGCIISSDYFDDGSCDCPNCADEPNWECGTGNCHCPTCGESSECFPTTTTLTPTTTTLTPTTTTFTSTMTTPKPTTTTPKPTTTTPKPTTTTFKPTTTTTAKPTSTTATPSTTALKTTTTTEEPSTTDIVEVESTVPQTSAQPTGVRTTTKNSTGGNGDSSLQIFAILLGVGFGAVVIGVVAFVFHRKKHPKPATNEVTTAVNPPHLDLAVGTLTTAPMGVAVTDACHASVAAPPMEVHFADTYDASDSVSTEVEGAGVAEHSNADAPRGTEWYVGDDGDYIDDDSEYERVLGDWAL